MLTHRPLAQVVFVHEFSNHKEMFSINTWIPCEMFWTITWIRYPGSFQVRSRERTAALTRRIRNHRHTLRISFVKCHLYVHRNNISTDL